MSYALGLSDGSGGGFKGFGLASMKAKNSAPVWEHRQKITEAKSEKQAKRKIASILQNTPKGWKITVSKRDTNLIDLPAGYVFSVHP